jgi:hypothetical protein
MGGLTDSIDFDDKLKALSPAEVAGWYSRLADFIEQRNTKVKMPWLRDSCGII